MKYDDVDLFTSPYYEEIKSLIEEEGLIIKKNLTINKSGKTYEAHKSYGHIQGKITIIYLTYYDAGYDPFGEIRIDTETNQIRIEFPLLQVFLQNNF